MKPKRSVKYKIAKKAKKKTPTYKKTNSNNKTSKNPPGEGGIWSKKNG